MARGMNNDSPTSLDRVKFLNSLDLDSIAMSTGWSSRRSGKLTPFTFCAAVIAASSMAAASLRSVALLAQASGSRGVSKQAIHQRIDSTAGDMLEAALAQALERKGSPAPELEPLGFRRILLQDSTTITLSASLNEAFPAGGNAKGKSAGVKVHATYDLRSAQFRQLSLRAANRSDQGFASQGAEEAEEGDLLLRDLGYFSLKALAAILARGADFITRWLPHTKLLDPATLEEIDLLELLKRAGSVDVEALAGSRRPMTCRLVAFKVPEEVAKQRRRRLRRDTRKRNGDTPSKRLLLLQDGQIYLTSCSSEKLSAQRVRRLYRQRWGIEIAFKGLKSHLKINSILMRSSAAMARCLVLGALIRAALVTSIVQPVLRKAFPSCEVSLLKLLSAVETLGLNLHSENLWNDSYLKELIRHCCYEKRSRKSLPERLKSLA